MQYLDNRTSSFVSLDSDSGVCLDNSTLSECCEVPQSVTGTYLSDTSGFWNTETNFSYIQNNYAVTCTGMEYTNAQWAEVFTDIKEQLNVIGKKSLKRDYSW
jgi:hypothetical protein